MENAGELEMKTNVGPLELPAVMDRKLMVGLIAIAVTLCLGCAAQVQTGEPLETLPTRPLPFKLRFAGGDRNHLPPSLADALDDSSLLELSYTEKVTDQNSAVPAVISMVDPLTIFGVPLGTYVVHAQATCSLTLKGRVIKNYSAESTVSRTYGLYHGSSFPELERQARQAVEQEIEQDVYRDTDEIALATKTDH
jgi:hypothetical protein